MFTSYTDFLDLRNKLAVLSAKDQEIFLNQMPKKDYEAFVIFSNRNFHGSFTHETNIDTPPKTVNIIT